MFKKLLSILLAIPLLANAASFYIDPSAQTDGSGTIGSPFNTLTGHQSTWTGNANYFIKAGTTWTGACGFLISASGADANNQIVIDSYGTGSPPIINCTSGSYGWVLAAKSFVTIQNLDIRTSNLTCIYLQGATSVTITRNEFRCGTANTINMEGGANTDFESIRISYNRFVTGTKLGPGQITNANLQAWHNIEIDHNVFESGVGNISAPYPIDFITGSGNTNTIGSLYIHDNKFNGNMGGGSMPSTSASVIRIAYSPISGIYPARKTATVTISIASPGVITWTGHALPVGTPVTFTTTGTLPTGISSGSWYYIVNDANYTANTFTVSTTPTGAAVNTSGTQSGVQTGNASKISQCVRTVFFDDVKIYNNEINGANGSIYLTNSNNSAIYNNYIHDIYSSAGISTFFTTNTPIYGNHIVNVHSVTAAGVDGIGIDSDVCNYNSDIYSNYVEGADGIANIDNSGQGIGIFANDNNKVYSNILYRNKQGIHLSDNDPRTYPIKVFNNTISGSTNSGILLKSNLGSIDYFYNNILHNNLYGARNVAPSLSAQVMDYNDYYGNGTDRQNDAGTAIVTGANDSAVNPSFVTGSGDAGFQLAPNSPAIGKGFCYLAVGCTYPDYNYRWVRPRPNVGAYQQYVPLNRTTVTR